MLEYSVDFTAVLISVVHMLLSRTCRETFVSLKKSKLDMQMVRTQLEIEHSKHICEEFIFSIAC